MKKFKILFFILEFFIFVFAYDFSFGAINLSVSPIKYEIEANTWAIITKQASIKNNWNTTIHIVMSKSDFVASNIDWKPKFIRRSEEVFWQELSKRISIDTKEFDLKPKEKKIVNFTIKVPEDATPGGHYWAVFFKNNSSEESQWAQVGINVDYGVLILLKVNWEIKTKLEIETPVIELWWEWDIQTYQNNSDTNSYFEENKDDLKKEDDCIIDLTDSRYDWKCVDSFDDIIKEITWEKINNLDNSTNDSKEKKEDDFDVVIAIPVQNQWNTHVKPEWKIILTDENWKIINKVWKKIKTNSKWAIIWEEIVDYIPINDIWWNVLPNTKRTFVQKWQGFPYISYNENWEQEIKYWSPWEYYTNQELNKHTLIFPWQRVCSKEETKKIKAKINLKYKNELGEDEVFNSAKEFEIKYNKKYIWLNPYFFILLWLIFLVFLFIYFIFRKKKKICSNKKCGRKIDIDMKICPYCGKKQKK